ncbi:MAG: hypothetical protein ABWX56_04580 [Mycetocola sp.]
MPSSCLTVLFGLSKRRTVLFGLSKRLTVLFARALGDKFMATRARAGARM